jgi:phosphoribosylamine--glycine ligase
MKILVIGGGGREHALVWKLRQSPAVSKLWCAPGNGGIAQDAECVVANLSDVKGLGQLALNLGADLTVVGPEQPLVLGVADEFARLGLRIFAPSKEGAQLEGSKIFAKHFLERHGIPTAAVHGIYDSAKDAIDGLHAATWPIVLKADGLCAGKGVLVAGSQSEAKAFIHRSMEKMEFGPGGGRLLVEQGIAGQELSFIVVADGENFVPLVPTRDHKRLLDNDLGPNTGGMGAFSSDDIISPELHQAIVDMVVRPTLRGLVADGCPYRGFLYFGLMLTSEGPKVLEFNCRLGDPETQPIMVRMGFDLAEALAAAAEGRLEHLRAEWDPGASLCVVMTSGGYPGEFETGMEIDGLAEAAATPGVAIFHSGTVADEGSDGPYYYTCGGRVLGVTSKASSVASARQLAYSAVRKIRFAGAHYRTDIAAGANGCEAARS